MSTGCFFNALLMKQNKCTPMRFRLCFRSLDYLLNLIFVILETMEEVCFSDTPQWMDGTTISQFLDAIEGYAEWSEEDKKVYALNHLKGKALEFSQQNLAMDMAWNDIKVKLFEKFQSHLSVWKKLQLKKYLVQNRGESVRSYFNRCVCTQYLLCDDYR